MRRFWKWLISLFWKPPGPVVDPISLEMRRLRVYREELRKQLQIGPRCQGVKDELWLTEQKLRNLERREELERLFREHTEKIRARGNLATTTEIGELAAIDYEIQKLEGVKRG